MNRLSITVIVRNEEENIKGCLENIKWADEIIVVDQSSTDATVEIAKKYTDKIFIRPAQGTCNVDRMFAIEKASCDWMLFLDADEKVPSELRDEIKKILEVPAYNAYYLGRKNFFLGRWIRYCGWYPLYAIKLFKRGFAYFPPKVHRGGYAKCEAGYIKEKTLHYTYNSFSQYFTKFNRYTSRKAKEEFEEGKRINFMNFSVYFILKPFFYFVRKYILWKGFRDGFRGLFISLSSALVIFATYAKLWEKQIKFK